MCGICGLIDWKSGDVPDVKRLEAMTRAIGHRGPDQLSIYRDGPVGLGHARLAILDSTGGGQPATNEDESVWVTCDGEIYNYPEQAHNLEQRGHLFRSRCDTEVILHLYEEHGPECVRYLNGQFAFALWDSRRRRLFLARDPLGIRPLYYYGAPGDTFAFGSEIKSLFALPDTPRALDPAGLDQAFTFWSPIAPRTMFEGIRQIPPGHYMVVDEKEIAVNRYWDLDYMPADSGNVDESNWVDRLRDALVSAVRMRMRADVPVGAYLSGGLDSSLTAAIVRDFSCADLETFAVRFEDSLYDETEYQEMMAAKLGARHHGILVKNDDIVGMFPAAVRHAETTLLRTAPVPLLALSRLVADCGIKVVVTGEGADEMFAGYNIFKENQIRRLWAKDPDSPLPRQLLSQLYPYINAGKGAFWQQFFAKGLMDVQNPCYSHMIRWGNTSALKRFIKSDIRARLGENAAIESYAVGLPPSFVQWDPLSQAQYIEITTFLSGYLLSSQGDRMATANGVEARLPFLDPDIVALSGQMPPNLRLRGMEEKYLLRRVARRFLPREVCDRPKQPYRAPVSAAFFSQRGIESVRAWATPHILEQSAVFEPAAVKMLFDKLAAKHGTGASEREDMAVAGILSTLLLYELFVRNNPSCDSPAIAVRHVKRTVAFSGGNK